MAERERGKYIEIFAMLENLNGQGPFSLIGHPEAKK